MSDRPRLGRTAAWAAVWAVISTGGAKIITLAGLALLARFLAPREFGLLAFAMVYITYAETIADLGSGMALIYWPDRREDAAQLTFVVNAVAGLFWCGLTLLLAPAIAAFFHSPSGEPIIRVLAFSFPIKFLGTTHDALAQKDLRFRSRLGPELALAGVKAAIAVVLAWRGFGAWSLVWGHLAGLACWTAGLWIVVPWRPTWSFPRDLLKPMLGYGRGIIIVNLLSAIVHHVDLAIVGRMLGATALGLFQMADKVPETTVTVILWVVSKVLFPAFSRIHAAGGSLRAAYLVATRYVSAITMPIAVELCLLSRPLVLVMFGPRWVDAAPLMSIMAIFTAFRSLSTHAGDALKAIGRSQLLAGISVIKALMMVPALIIAGYWSTAAVAGTETAITAAGTILTLGVISRLLHVRFTDIVFSFGPGIGAGAAMGAAMYAFARFGPRFGNVLQIGIEGTLGLIVYAAVLWLLDRDIFQRAHRSFLSAEPAVGQAAP